MWDSKHLHKLPAAQAELEAREKCVGGQNPSERNTVKRSANSTLELG